MGACKYACPDCACAACLSSAMTHPPVRTRTRCEALRAVVLQSCLLCTLHPQQGSCSDERRAPHSEVKTSRLAHSQIQLDVDSSGGSAEPWPPGQVERMRAGETAAPQRATGGAAAAADVERSLRAELSAQRGVVSRLRWVDTANV